MKQIAILLSVADDVATALTPLHSGESVSVTLDDTAHTTDCGSTTGGLIPVIEVIGNPNRMQLIADNADFDSTPIIRGEATIKAMGEALYAKILAVAAGKLTKSEVYGHFEV